MPLACNSRDVVNLEPLLVRAGNLKLGQTPFGASAVFPAPLPPSAPFRAHVPTIERLLHQMGGGGAMVMDGRPGRAGFAQRVLPGECGGARKRGPGVRPAPLNRSATRAYCLMRP